MENTYITAKDKDVLICDYRLSVHQPLVTGSISYQLIKEALLHEAYTFDPKKPATEVFGQALSYPVKLNKKLVKCFVDSKYIPSYGHQYKVDGKELSLNFNPIYGNGRGSFQNQQAYCFKVS